MALVFCGMVQLLLLQPPLSGTTHGKEKLGALCAPVLVFCVAARNCSRAVYGWQVLHEQLDD